MNALFASYGRYGKYVNSEFRTGLGAVMALCAFLVVESPAASGAGGNLQAPSMSGSLTGDIRLPGPPVDPLGTSGPAGMPGLGGKAGKNGLPAVRGLKQYHRVDIDPRAMLERLRGFERGPFRLDLGGNWRWDLELEPSGIRSPGYVVRHITPHGVETVQPSPDLSFRGHVRGRAGSRVRLSFQDGRIHGYVDEGGGPEDRIYLEPMDHYAAGMPSGSIALYRESDVVPETGVSCGLSAHGHGGNMPLPATPYGKALPGLPQPGMEGLEIRVPKAQGAGKAAAAQGAPAEPCALVELAVAVEYSMVRGLGSAAAAEKRINDIYNMVDGLYQDPAINIHVRISEIIIETQQSNTWGATANINQYLNNLTSWMSGGSGFKKPFDVASLWYYSLGGGTVGLAWVGTVCTNRRSNVIRYFTPTTRSMMIDAAHEMGHNFNAPHISNPSWLMNPSITGSNDKWDPSTIATVTAHKRSRTCLSGCQVAPIAAFSVTGPSACSERRTFTDLSAGEPTAWLWDFGDGSTSRERSPTHTYASPGRYKASLSATNAYGSATATRSNIRVENIPPPTAKSADGCAPASLTLEAQGTGTLRWYDSAAGGPPLAVGRTFTTPQLTRARTYYVENGEPDLPTTRVGPLSSGFGPGNHFISNSERRLFFDVHRPATLVSASVNAGAAGPRTIEILDSRDRRIMARAVHIPAGVSRVPLGFQLPVGVDYAIKVSGPGDSVNLFRNSAGAAYPYVSPDTLVTITGSDAVTGDSLTEAGYYYFFYDWEIREVGCASARVPVEAKLTCPVGVEPAPAAFAAALRPLSRGRYRLEGVAPRSGRLVMTVRSLDGALIRRETREVAAGRMAFEIDLGGNASRLMLVQLRLGESRMQQVVHGL